jgi:hypothetical protein
MYGTYQRFNLSVAASNREVIRKARAVIAVHHRRAPERREARKAFYRDMLEYHDSARTLYRRVSSGAI